MTWCSSKSVAGFVKRVAWVPALLILAAAAPEYTAAPVPSERGFTLTAVETQDDATSEPKLRPDFFHTLNTGSFRGDGFTPGSTVTSEQERQLSPEVGFSLIVPLQ